MSARVKESLPARIGLGLLALILLLALAWILVSLMRISTEAKPLQSSPRAERMWQGGISQVPLEDAAQRAQARATAWAQDVYLVRAEAGWRPDRDSIQTDTPPVAWSFYYYSPGQRALASVLVSDDTLFWIPPLEIPSTPQPLRQFPPRHGIETAWLSFRAAGGDAFVQRHASARIDFRLQQQGDGSVWRISAFQEEAHLEVFVDAESGQVLMPEHPQENGGSGQ